MIISFRRPVVCQLSRQELITIWDLAHLNLWSFQHSFFPLSIKLTEFVVVRFSTFLSTSIKLIKSLVARPYALVWTMKSVRYSSVLELKLIKNQIAFGAVTFSISAAVLAWCRAVSDNEVIYQRFKAIRDLMLQQHNRLKDFAVEFVRNVKICAQYSSAAHQNRAWQDLNVLTINAEKRQERIKKSIRFMKRRWSDETMNQLMLEIRNHHVANEIVKLVKKYSINLEKVMKRLQLTVFKCKEKMNRNIRAIAVYILNDFKRAHSKIYSDLSAPIRENLRAVDLMIRNIKLIKNF